MAIGTAIAIGIGLGNLAKNAIFNYTKNEYQQKIIELDQLIAKLNTHLETLISLRQEIPGFWEDDAARETERTLDETINKVRANMKTAQDLSDVFKKTVAELDGSQSVLSGLIQDAFALVSGLPG